MVFTFPGFGSLRYIVPKIMNEFGLEYVLPEENGSILDKGVELSPEEMCQTSDHIFEGQAHFFR